MLPLRGAHHRVAQSLILTTLGRCTVPTVEVNGEKLNFVQKGAGPAMVLLHGIGARADLWVDVIDKLSDRYTMVAFDLRGHGESTCNQELSVAAMASDMLQATKKLQLSSFHLVGVSLAARACELAAMNLEPVQSLVVSGIGLNIEKVLADEIYGIREAVHYFSPADFAEQVSQALLNPDASAELAGALGSSIQSLTKQRYLKALEALAAADLGTAAPQVKSPVLVLHGELDDFISTAAADALALAAGGGGVRRCPDAGDLANIDNPAAFSTALAEFRRWLQEKPHWKHLKTVTEQGGVAACSELEKIVSYSTS